MSGGHWDTLMGNRPAKDAPRSDRLAQRWRLKATSGRVWECAIYRVETGVELRVQTEGKDDPVWTQLFRTEGEDLEVASESWRATLLAKGFTEA